MLDEVWIVEAAEEIRLERLATRGMTREEALRRIDNQRGLFEPARFNGKVVRIIEDKSVIDSLLK
jgi:dephospho-CoA kinase